MFASRAIPGARRRLVTAAIVAGAVFAGLVPAEAAKPAAKSGTPAIKTGLENLERQVQEFVLPNGLRFLVVERHDAPVFSFQTLVNAGSANDGLGTTGIAHMMEHMAFKGTAIVGTKDYAAERPLLEAEERAWDALLNERRKGTKADSAKLASLDKAFTAAQETARQQVVSNEFQKILESSGAQNWNAFTADDVTGYFYSIPSNRLELWALMEAGRMAHPVFREFYKERDVVYEERRMRYESSPIGRLLLEYIQASYVAHPYGTGGIGHPSDLKTFSRTEGDEYFKRHYVAKNMTVAVVGDVTLPEVKRVADTYWSTLSDAPPPAPIDTVEPEQKAERRVILEDAAQPVVAIGWHGPAGTDPTFPAYQALADLLGGGDHARLNKILVKEKKVAAQIQCLSGFPGLRYPSQFIVFVVPAAGQDPLEIEKLVYEVLDQVQTSQPFTPAELEGYKVRIKAQKIGAAESNSSLCGELAQAQSLYGDWREFFREQERVQSLTPQNLLDAMKRTMIRSNRTVGMIVNPAQATNTGGR